VGDRLSAGLAGLGAYDGVAEIRRVGTMTGVEVHPAGERTGFEVCRAARRRGVIIRPLGDVVVLMPPLGITDDELDELVGVVDESVREVVR
jgi:adenosylmethionine-8-amino-7-oxononanoate aminotransferase